MLDMDKEPFIEDVNGKCGKSFTPRTLSIIVYCTSPTPPEPVR